MKPTFWSHVFTQQTLWNLTKLERNTDEQQRVSIISELLLSFFYLSYHKYFCLHRDATDSDVFTDTSKPPQPPSLLHWVVMAISLPIGVPVKLEQVWWLMWLLNDWWRWSPSPQTPEQVVEEETTGRWPAAGGPTTSRQPVNSLARLCEASAAGRYHLTLHTLNHTSYFYRKQRKAPLQPVWHPCV